MPRVYNLRKEDPNHPEKLALLLKVPQVSLPTSATTSQWMGYIRDQGNEGSCTGQLKAEYRDLLYRKLFIFEKDKTVAPNDFRASAGFAYKTNLIADGDLGQDNGSTIHQTFKTLNQLGICLESSEPYSDSDFSVAPSAEQYQAALIYKGGPYHSIPDLYTVKSCIASGYAVGAGIDVYDSFEGPDLAQTGIMPMPKSGENLLGGHAQHFLDFDDTFNFPGGEVGGIFVQNSWGSSWGRSASGRSDRGCYWMPYKYVTAGYVNDMWMMHEGKSW